MDESGMMWHFLQMLEKSVFEKIYRIAKSLFRSLNKNESFFFSFFNFQHFYYSTFKELHNSILPEYLLNKEQLKVAFTIFQKTELFFFIQSTNIVIFLF